MSVYTDICSEMRHYNPHCIEEDVKLKDVRMGQDCMPREEQF